MIREKAGDYVASCASLAALLEVSAYPKPGNVHRTRDFPDTTYEHFLTGGVAINPIMRNLALRGYDSSMGSIPWSEINLGKMIYNAVTQTFSWQKGGNVNLGVIMLFSPLAAAGGATLSAHEKIEAPTLKTSLKKIIRNSKPEDSIHLYDAVNLAMTSNTLGQVEELDVKDEESKNRILKENINLLSIFDICAKRDSICREWMTDFKITFDVGYPYFSSLLNTKRSINSSIIDTFLHILSQTPDSLIIRKSGLESANYVSGRALEILKVGGSSSQRGLDMLLVLDEELHLKGGDLNPGTTADLTAASIFVTLLEGWRP